MKEFRLDTTNFFLRSAMAAYSGSCSMDIVAPRSKPTPLNSVSELRERLSKEIESAAIPGKSAVMAGPNLLQKTAFRHQNPFEKTEYSLLPPFSAPWQTPNPVQTPNVALNPHVRILTLPVLLNAPPKNLCQGPRGPILNLMCPKNPPQTPLNLLDSP